MVKLPTLNKRIFIRNIGHLCWGSAIPDGPGTRITNKLLSELIVRFIKHAAKNVESNFVSSFAFGELQLNSSFAPAISEFSEAFLMEYPLYNEDRTLRELPDNKFRRIDYWFYFKKIDFFLELKHSRVSTQQEPEREDIKKSWSDVSKQADSAYDRSVSEATLGAKGASSIGLHVFTVYHSSNRKVNKASDFFKDYDLGDTFKYYFRKLPNPKPNWTGILHFNDDFIEKSSSVLDKGREFYPGLLFFAYVREMKEYKKAVDNMI